MKSKWPWISFLCLMITLALSYRSFTQTRDPDKVYRVAILPFLIHSQENLDYLREGIYDILSSRITAEGKIVVIERSIVERAFYEERPMRLDESVAKRIGRKAGADYMILGSLTKIGDYISLDARLISIAEEKPPLGVFTQHKGIEDVMVKIGDFAQEIGNKILGRRAVVGRPTEPRHPYLVTPKRQIGRMGPEGVGFKKTQTFDFEMKGLDIGDVDGDKKNEVVAMDKHHLYVFKYEGDKMSLLWRIEQGYEHNFLTLDVADVNRNGLAEIIVTSVVEDDLRSFIVEYEEGRFKKISEEVFWYFRVLYHPKEGPTLMGQRMGSDGLFSGRIYKFIWKKKSFEKGPKMDFPKDTKIFGLTVADIRNQGKMDIVKLDDFDRLTILSPDEKFSWRSNGRFGGTNNFYDTLKRLQEPLRPRDVIPTRVYIPSRILTKDIDGDEIPEVIVNRNESSTGTLFDKVRSYEKGEIYNLIWEAGGLITNWKTREINGYITDYQIRDADNDGDEELVVAVMNIGAITQRKSTSNILFFELY